MLGGGSVATELGSDEGSEMVELEQEETVSGELSAASRQLSGTMRALTGTAGVLSGTL